MSSFVIGKAEYIKAAGLVAGLAAEARFWVYDHKQGRNMTADDYYNYFCLCYKYNAYSVQEQYHDKATEADPADYRDLFQEYKQRATGLFIHNKTIPVIAELSSFFRSALYQVENDYCNNQMNHFFSAILWEMVTKTGLLKGKSWGAVENIPDGPRVCRIM